MVVEIALPTEVPPRERDKVESIFREVSKPPCSELSFSHCVILIFRFYGLDIFVSIDGDRGRNVLLMCSFLRKKYILYFDCQRAFEIIFISILFFLVLFYFDDDGGVVYYTALDTHSRGWFYWDFEFFFFFSKVNELMTRAFF